MFSFLQTGLLMIVSVLALGIPMAGIRVAGRKFQ